MLERYLDDGGMSQRTDKLGLRTLLSSIALFYEGKDGMMRAKVPPAIIWVSGSIRDTGMIGHPTDTTPVYARDAYNVDVYLWAEDEDNAEAMRVALRSALHDVCSPKGYRFLDTTRAKPNPQQSEKGEWLHCQIEIYMFSPRINLPLLAANGSPRVVTAANVVANRSPAVEAPIAADETVILTSQSTTPEEESA